MLLLFISVYQTWRSGSRFLLPAYVVVTWCMWISIDPIAYLVPDETPRYVLNLTLTRGDEETYLRGQVTSSHHYPLTPELSGLTARTLLVYVMSRPSAYQTRQMIRSTWGDVSVFRDSGVTRMTLMFVVGRSPGGSDKSTVNRSSREISLWEESLLYSDVLQLDVGESYYNLSLKGLTAMSWIIKNTDAMYMMKVDEDVVVNTFSWIKIVDGLVTNNISCSVVGLPFRGTVPRRAGKYRMTRNMYSLMIYPTFVTGPSYLLTRDAMAAILEASEQFVQPFLLEDIYLHGILGNQVGVRMLGLPRRSFLRYFKEIGEVKNSTVPILSIHGISKADVRRAWRVLTNKFTTGRYLLQAGDYSSRLYNVTDFIPKRWRLSQDVALKHSCNPGSDVNLSLTMI